MRFSGEFLIQLDAGCELVLPNQFTTVGMQQVLKAAFQQADLIWYAGLCAHNPADNLALNAIQEPAIGTNGYARQQLDLTTPNWPTIGVINGESYVQTRDFTFVSTGAYSNQVNRLFLTDGTYVIAISSPLEGGLQTISANLTTRYRLYFR